MRVIAHATQVTNCFGLPKVSSESAEVDNYTYSMMKLFREVGMCFEYFVANEVKKRHRGST